jgi:hypothetical protein
MIPSESLRAAFEDKRSLWGWVSNKHVVDGTIEPNYEVVLTTWEGMPTGMVDR